jgi:glycopeptide antibiotics resistance protein
MAEEFKNYLNKFIYSDLTDIISNVINSYIGGLKLKILIYLLNQKKSKKNIAREFDRVHPEFKCIKEHILKNIVS